VERSVVSVIIGEGGGAGLVALPRQETVIAQLPGNIPYYP